MTVKKWIFVIVLLIAASGLLSERADAQKQDPRWSGPFQLSEPGRRVVGFLDSVAVAADSYGFVHTFWLEEGVQDERYVIQYARFDGVNWSSPVDIYLSGPDDAFGFLSRPVVTQDGTLHLFYSKSQFGTVLHMSAPADRTLSAQNWTAYPLMREPYFRVSVAESVDGTLHMVGASLFGATRGVYYQRSTDGGRSWSARKWLDPDLPAGDGAATALLRIDQTTDILHVVYRHDRVLSDGSSRGQGVFYIRSLDSGRTWSRTLPLDVLEEDPAELRGDDLVLAAHSGQVHVLWPGNFQMNREHAYSLDSGDSWVGPGRIFGNLHGVAGEDLVVDGAGNFHFLSQLRYPQGLYEMVWQGEHWDFPSLVYLISESPDDPIGDRLHIHNLRGAVRRGNQLVALFSGPPTAADRAVYAFHRDLPDIEPADIQPTPLPTTPPTQAPPTAPVEEASATQIPSFSALPPEDPRTPGANLVISISAVLLFLGVFVVIRWRASAGR